MEKERRAEKKVNNGEKHNGVSSLLVQAAFRLDCAAK